MRDGDRGLDDAAALRAAFDRAFASTATPSDAEGDGFLLARVGGDPYALPLLEIAEVTEAARIVALPSADPAFVGLTSLRGGMVPVFALGVVLGYPAAATPGAWLARCRHPEGMVGYAFDAVEGFARAIAEAAPGPAAPRGVAAPLRREIVALGGLVRPVVRVAALRAAIQDRVSSRQRGS
jgi:chemotaxis signal transduction protein